MFDRLAANLAECRHGSLDVVVCPLCLQRFSKSALAGDPPALSEEHIVPKALGGTLITLTCRTCNNRQGSDLDGHFVRMIRSRDAVAGFGPELKGHVRVGDVSLPMKISWGDGSGPNTIRVLGGTEAALEGFRDRAKSLSDGDKVDLTFSLDYIGSNAQRAVLRIAYLSLFMQLGYRYVFSEAAAFVRVMIDGHHPDELWRFLPQLSEVADSTGRPVIICPLGDQDPPSAYLVVIRVSTRHRVYYEGAMLPGPLITKDSVLANADSILSGLQARSLTIQVKPEG
ncbi:MAG TPA: HNH endonuclease [Bryobacteraceae bacterium]|nr:HNH endonuclease [Bryobacteraceae bacterium]